MGRIVFAVRHRIWLWKVGPTGAPSGRLAKGAADRRGAVILITGSVAGAIVRSVFDMTCAPFSM